MKPAQLVDLAAARGVRVFALTDHDSTQGIDEAREAASRHEGFTLVPGCELSTDIEGAEVHVLGYLDFEKVRNEDLQEELAKFRAGRYERGRLMVEKLSEIGVSIDWERVLEIAGDASVGRPHVARALVEAGYVPAIKDAFDLYIGRDGPAYVEREKMTPQEAIRTLVRYGAPPVLAHPTYVRKPDQPLETLEPFLIEMKEAGLMGMEVYYRDYSPEVVETLARLAKKVGLMPLGGSDYHALANPGEREPGDIPLPASVAKDFLEKELSWVPTGALT